jgi:alginate O-acetyltransferase complex protein AlgI
LASLAEGGSRRFSARVALAVSIISNVTVLATFKYFNFFAANVGAALQALGANVSAPTLRLLLPIGISFYSFEAISYAVDAYKQRTTVARSYLDLLLFITFFPHLVAGPIVRARDFLPQLESRRSVTMEDLVTGLQWIIVGYFFKVGVADNLSSSVEHVFAAPQTVSTTEAWLATLYFAVQIFCDFAGYTSVARGLAKIMGFDLTPNFDFPYLARGFSDFWKRWHISLSSWLRDYVYIPLGGSRAGRATTYRNLMITMLVGGLWHGASWTFVVWGGLHGAYLVVEHAVRARSRRDASALKSRPNTTVEIGYMLFTFVLVLVAWVFFRAASLTDAHALLRVMFWPAALRLTSPAKSMLKDGVWLVPIFIYYVFGYLQERGVRFSRSPVRRGVALGVLAFFTLVCREVSDAFIYFQF